MTTKNLLVELFVEELPPKALKKLGEAFATVLADSLKAQGLVAADAAVTHFASPRRLAVHVAAVAPQAADKAVSQKLMPVAVGLDASGNATPALLKKLQALGADASAVPALKRAMDGKAEALFYDSIVKGATLVDGLQKALLETIAKLPIPKVMSYQLQSGCELPGWTSVSFVRPAHGLVALHGSDVVPVQALGLQSGNRTEGHRFEAAVSPVVIADADAYAVTLAKDGAVIASFAERRAEIVRQLDAAAAQVGGGCKPIEDDALLDEVTALVERPNVLICEFEAQFLEVPQECLILTMKANQKYFPLLDAAGKLTNKFLVVSNIKPDDASFVIGGNERVVRPRLADAKFFFDQDRKKTLASRVEGLGKVVYHNKLGTQGERVERVRAIAKWVAERIGAEPALADRAAVLAKADLLTDMVGEFPELQGVMGGYYARHDGEDESVAEAIEDQYLLQRDHTAAVNLVSFALDIADRVETLVGIWGIGLKPTGEKDPFALRRHALTLGNRFELLGLATFLDVGQMRLHLAELLDFAQQQFPPELLSSDTVSGLSEFIYDRYQNRLVANGLYRPEVVDAVVSTRPPLHDIVPRIQAVKVFAALPEAPALAAANKRIGNILKKTDDVDAHVSEVLLQEAAEKALFAAMQTVLPQAQSQWQAGDYTASLQSLAALRVPVDAFFEDVMVNAEQMDLRLNRLGLLKSLHVAMNRVADLSKLAA
ncbi:glycine--tRNA ligase subunit beta [Rhodoferax mekongensis]|uniref:Glycine--tRNA ligase beta subunit n=1 Tax=Rhodoferax mekongensis TaxID=3068341 RepID=A0ABZ0B1F5_9BURK|nr:glycine--tRNA ligase subunit beta [Rhodoferax sp. TBRC 17307]WNO04864.1 glycine--tRNA ligase subunit beta [Rhodoferax sp. TBRC 17307]